MSTIPEICYWLSAANLAGVGAATFRRWLECFPDIQTLFHATESELQVAGLTAKAIAELQRADFSEHAAILNWSEQPDCQLIAWNDSAYPTLLKELTDAPLVLYMCGDIAALNQPQIAIVGSRNPTPAGRESAEQFAYALAQAGLVITSGLALGIDAASHIGALAAGMPTVAVLGAGLANIYPASHRQLANQIASSGALVTEFPPQMLAIASNFPRRNRIISALCLGVVVIEAAVRSGSLITARFAAEQGREVFAMPGSIHNPLARGCHQLIRQGAKLIETAADIIEELSALNQVLAQPSIKKTSTNDHNLDKKHQELFKLVGYEATPLDKLITRSGLTVSEVSSMLVSLELLGYVNFTPGGYVRCVVNSR
jgi:DNA processing protein